MWFNYLLYDQPLPGRDVRLTIDLSIQNTVDDLMGDFHGSAVVMNAQSGEILAIASHPFYNANEIVNELDSWRMDESSPLLNRAVQGAYPIGNLITPFLLTQADISRGSIIDSFPGYLSAFQIDRCAIQSTQPYVLRASIQNGCDSSTIHLARSLKRDEFINTVNQYSLTSSQAIGLPVNQAASPPQEVSWFDFIFGSNLLRVNPLQIATAASSISANGLMPAARITSAVNIADQGWVSLSPSISQRVMSQEKANAVNDFLNSETISGWEITALSMDDNGVYSWYLAGTPVSWPGAPVVVVLVLERDSPEFAQLAGREIYRQATE
ncbi:MAG: hypothetical protein FJZ98_07390 [Chloroflexi bacterium]|nr:hypothetical protein [Chloroflexota bacterium]